MPSLPKLDREGRVRLKADGKRVYRPIITFEGAAGRERWSVAILRALADAGIAPAGATEDAP